MADEQGKKLVYVFVEYNPARFFMGWNFYMVPVIHDLPLRDESKHFWLGRQNIVRERIFAFLELSEGNQGNAFTRDFMCKYPSGVLLWMRGENYLVEFERSTDSSAREWECLMVMREYREKRWLEGK